MSGDNVTLTGYTNTGLSLSGTSGGYISAASCSQFGVIPTVVSGSAGTYFCDGGWFNGGGVRYPFVGAGAGYASAVGGAFTFTVYDVPSITRWYFGCGLKKGWICYIVKSISVAYYIDETSRGF